LQLNPSDCAAITF